MLTLNNLNFFELPAPQASSETSELGEATENFAAILGGISALLQKPEGFQQNQQPSRDEPSVEILSSVENVSSAEPVSPTAYSYSDFPAQPDLLEKPGFNFKSPMQQAVSPNEIPPTENAPDSFQATPELKTGQNFQPVSPKNDSKLPEIETPVSSTPQKELKFTTALPVDADAPNLEIPAQTKESRIFAGQDAAEVEILEIPKQAKVLPFAPKNAEPQFDILIAAPTPSDAETTTEIPKIDEPPVDWIQNEENRLVSPTVKTDVPIDINPHAGQKTFETGNVKNLRIEPVKIEKPKFDVVKTETTIETAKVEPPPVEPPVNQPSVIEPGKIKISDVLRQFSTEQNAHEEFHFDHPEIGQIEFAAHTLKESDFVRQTDLIQPDEFVPDQSVETDFEPQPLKFEPKAAQTPEIAVTQSETPEVESFAPIKPATQEVTLDFEETNALWEQPSIKTPPVSDRQKTDEKNNLWQPDWVETPPIYDRHKPDEKNAVLNSNQSETPVVNDTQKTILPQDFPKIVQSIRQNVLVKTDKKTMLSDGFESAAPQITFAASEEKVVPIKFTQSKTLIGGAGLTGKENSNVIKFSPTPRSMPERAFEAVKLPTAAAGVDSIGEKNIAPEQFWQPDWVETPPIIVREKPDLSSDLPKIERDLAPHFQIGQKFDLNEVEPRAPDATDFSELNISEQIEPRLIEIAGLVAKKDEKQILKMRLHPAELGTVEIRLEKNSAGVLEAQFQTENEAAKQVLTQNLDKLRDALQDSGWQIGRMDVTQQSFSSEAQNQRQQEQPQKSELYQNDFPANPFARNADQHGEQDQDSAHRLVSLRA